MSGKPRRHIGGQLALMDSMVFFAAALVMCSIIISYGRPSPPTDSDRRGDSDPAEILQVLLRASIGRSATIELGGSYHLDGSEDVASCIAVEVTALRLGVSETVFASLNEIIVEVVEAICNPVFEPILIVYDFADGHSSHVLRLPDKEPDSMDRCASSVAIPGNDGHDYLAVLVLDPTTLSERA